MRIKVKDLNSTQARLETSRKERAKVIWLEHADSNSHFFHNFTSCKINSSRILQVKFSNVELLDDPISMLKYFLNFFRKC